MNISLNWLKKYIDISLPVDRISEILTDIGLEVEGLKRVETIKGGLKGIVAGQVIECDQHPNADKLSLTKVDIGAEDLLQIVCGAPNVAKGQKVWVATIGTTLYDKEGEPWKIKKGKIRGEASHGMICAEDELGLGNDHDGIMVLPEEVKAGQKAKEYYKIEEDYIFDIGLTPNRSDATSHLGVAKDLAAYLKINESWNGNVTEPSVEAFMPDRNTVKVKVEIENEEACPRYTGVSFANVKVGDSPQWMKELLQGIGVRSINNIVDITNFILHEYGQPLHAFDANKISNDTVRVKTLKEGSSFISLDEKERKLSATDLMICDGSDKPMCLAGIFGGLDSGVTDSTTNIFLEAAHFDAAYVRKSSTKHLLRSDAAKVFEKGSDPNITVEALKRAAILFKEYASAEIVSEIIDVYPEPIKPKEIRIAYNRVNTIIGTEIEKDEIHNILRAMDMELSPMDNNNLLVSVPTNKADVLREIDVIEEILRIYGFNKVPIPEQLKTAIAYQNYPTKRDVKNVIADTLASNGFCEMMGLSLVESKYYAEDSDSIIYINNTSNIHLDIMRPDALISGLSAVANNINHQQNNLKLFEFGRVYEKNEDGAFVEKEFLSLFISGSKDSSSWSNSNSGKVNFFDIKKWVHLILDRLNIGSYQTMETEISADYDFGLKYHRGPKNLIELAKIKNAVLKKHDIKQEVFYAYFDLSSIMKSAMKSNLTTHELSKYPSTSRDLALVIDNAVKFEQIIALTKKTEKKLISDIQLFDIYKNEEQLGAGKKSYAVKFVFQDHTKTLKDKEVDKVINNLVDIFGRELGAIIRK